MGDPQKISAAVMAKRIEAAIPARRVQDAKVRGMLVSMRPADQRAVPAAKDGMLASRVLAVPVSMTDSPMQ